MIVSIIKFELCFYIKFISFNSMTVSLFHKENELKNYELMWNSWTHVLIFMIRNAKKYSTNYRRAIQSPMHFTDTFAESSGNSLNSVAQINPSNNIVSSILLSLPTLLSFWSPLLSYIVRWLIMPYCVIYIFAFYLLVF